MATTPEKTNKNKTFQGRIIQKHDTKANWEKATNFVPLKGEIIVYDDLNKIKIGDGSTKINDLKFDTATFYVKLTQEANNPVTADKNLFDIYDAYLAGYEVNAIVSVNDSSCILPLMGVEYTEMDGPVFFFSAIVSLSSDDTPGYIAAFGDFAGWNIWSGNLIRDKDLADVAKTGSYTDLVDKPTIPSVGNGTLTIQKNGTSAGTFTANATTDKTINIIVPTKVSELTDDVVKGKYLSLTGGTMTGNININNKTITNLKTPTANTEAANKKYVDD
ncbi:MAG: hypothetical protein MSA15_10255 [Clostridium sp.]|nr:hypothetical protein [Clostridium sp.]